MPLDLDKWLERQQRQYALWKEQQQQQQQQEAAAAAALMPIQAPQLALPEPPVQLALPGTLSARQQQCYNAALRRSLQDSSQNEEPDK
jgi:hypothetical protein